MVYADYTILEDLCRAHNTTVKAICDELKLERLSLSRINNHELISCRGLKLLSRYFGVSKVVTIYCTGETVSEDNRKKDAMGLLRHKNIF